ncbi:Uncharacterised protein [Mycobacteroides abscessus]|nr:Uncharacterised protein [Mycobacteroides abscessus]
MTTLAAPMPASASTVDRTSTVVVGEDARSTRDSAVRARATVAVRSSPNRRVTAGARKPNTANDAAGTVPSSPATATPNPRSAPTISSSGVNPVTAVRRLRAVSATAKPAQSVRRPGRTRGREGERVVTLHSTLRSADDGIMG